MHARAIIALVSLLLASACAPLSSSGPRDEAPADASSSDSDAIVRRPTPRCPLPGQRAVAEICNAFDDDCDGAMDEGVCSDPCDVFGAR